MIKYPQFLMVQFKWDKDRALPIRLKNMDLDKSSFDGGLGTKALCKWTWESKRRQLKRWMTVFVLFCFVLNFPLKACHKVGCILDWYLQVTDFWKLNVSLSFHGFFPWHKLMNKFIYLLRYETAWFYRLLRGKQDQWIEFQEESVFPSFKDRHISPKFPRQHLKVC